MEVISMDTLIIKIMNFAQKLVDADRASLFLVDAKTNQLYARIFDIQEMGEWESSISLVSLEGIIQISIVFIYNMPYCIIYPPSVSQKDSDYFLPLLSSGVKNSQEMLQNLWQCQVTTWTIVHSYAKYCSCKPPSNWETRDSPFIRGVPSLKKPSLQCCQTIKQIYNRLPIHSSKHSFFPFIHKSWWKL